MNQVIYEATPAEHALAVDWHGGQNSMLYAVASTGGLALGTHRPRWWDGEPMTDTEWAGHLLNNLVNEVEDIVPQVEDRMTKMMWKMKLIHIMSEVEKGY